MLCSSQLLCWNKRQKVLPSLVYRQNYGCITVESPSLSLLTVIRMSVILWWTPADCLSTAAVFLQDQSGKVRKEVCYMLRFFQTFFCLQCFAKVLDKCGINSVVNERQGHLIKPRFAVSISIIGFCLRHSLATLLFWCKPWQVWWWGNMHRDEPPQCFTYYFSKLLSATAKYFTFGVFGPDHLLSFFSPLLPIFL